DFFQSRARIEALRDGPAGSRLESFARALSEAGYATITARRHLRAAEHFVYWAHRHGLPVYRWNESFLARFDRHLSRCHCPHYKHTKRLEVVHGARSEERRVGKECRCRGATYDVKKKRETVG